MKIFIIISHDQKHLFEEKKKIIEESSRKYQIQTFFGHKTKNIMHFDLEESMNLLLKADYYLADLTYERPSCYFEVGYIQALGYPIQILAQRGTEIFQVLHREQVEFYSNLAEFKKIVVETFEQFLEIETVR